MVFIELRCGYTGTDIEYEGPNKCLSTHNETPHDWAADTQRSVSEVFSSLVKASRLEGWVATRDEGLLCPRCVKKFHKHRRAAIQPV